MPKLPLNIDTKNVVTDSDERLGEMMLFVAKRCEKDGGFGATKLNKIIFFADFLKFRATGKSITGCRFMRLPQGPAPRRCLPVQKALIKKGRAVLREEIVWSGLVQKRLTPLSEPDLSAFSAEDISTVTAVIDHLWNKNAAEVSELSHTLPCWQLAGNEEDIPLEAAFIMSLELPESDAAKGKELMAKHGW